MTRRFLLAALLVCAAPAAQAAPTSNPAADSMRMARIRGPMQMAVKNPKLFDGKQIPPDADIKKVEELNMWFAQAIRMFEGDWPRIGPDGQNSPEGKALKADYDEAKAYATALAPALQQRKQQDAANETAAKEKATAEDQKCYGFWKQINVEWGLGAIKIRAGTRGLGPDNVKEALAELEKIQGVCASLGGAAGLAHCTRIGHRQQEKTPPEVCEAVTHRDEILQQGLLMGMEERFTNVGSLAATPEKLRANDGWIETKDAFFFDKYLYFSDEEKQKLMAEWKPAFDAAGVTLPPESPALKKMIETKDKLRATVEELAPTYSTTGKPCKGYWCPLVKKSVAEWHPKAKILKLTQEGEVKLSYSSSGRPTEAYMNGLVLFQVPGEKWCQLRSWSVAENGTGRAPGVPLYYVRVQACK